jgi:hypothetical protein
LTIRQQDVHGPFLLVLRYGRHWHLAIRLLRIVGVKVALATLVLVVVGLGVVGVAVDLAWH